MSNENMAAYRNAVEALGLAQTKLKTAQKEHESLAKRVQARRADVALAEQTVTALERTIGQGGTPPTQPKK